MFSLKQNRLLNSKTLQQRKCITLYPGSRRPARRWCLSVVVASLGTGYEIDTKDKILFFEDIDEQPHRIDRYLTQLIMAGKLQQAKGIISAPSQNANICPKTTTSNSGSTASRHDQGANLCLLVFPQSMASSSATSPTNSPSPSADTPPLTQQTAASLSNRAWCEKPLSVEWFRS